MPALLTILTKRQIWEFQQGKLPPGQRKEVEEAIRQDERARAYYRSLVSKAGTRQGQSPEPDFAEKE